MKKEKVIDMFYDLVSGRRKQIIYSKGYKVFEEVFDEFTNGAYYLQDLKFELKKEEEGFYKENIKVTLKEVK